MIGVIERHELAKPTQRLEAFRQQGNILRLSEKNLLMRTVVHRRVDPPCKGGQLLGKRLRLNGADGQQRATRHAFGRFHVTVELVQSPFESDLVCCGFRQVQCAAGRQGGVLPGAVAKHHVAREIAG